MNGDGVYVDAGDGLAESAEGFFRREFGLPRGCDEVGHRFGDERAGAARGVEDALFEGLVDDFVDDGAREPPRRVVLAELPALMGGDDGLIEDGGDVRRGLQPVEPGDAAGDVTDQGLAAYFGGPREEVGLDDALESSVVTEALSPQQVRGVGFRQVTDVYAEGSLDDEADDDAEVGVADERGRPALPGSW